MGVQFSDGKEPCDLICMFCNDGFEDLLEKKDYRYSGMV